MQFFALFATVVTYVAFIAQTVHSYPVPLGVTSKDVQTNDAIETGLFVRYAQPMLSEDIVARDWKTQAKKLWPSSWHKEAPPPPKAPLQIKVTTEVMQHYDSLPHQHIDHPIPKKDGKYHRVQMPQGSGPRPLVKHQNVMVIASNQPGVAGPVPVSGWTPRPLPRHGQGAPNTMKDLPPIPHGHS